MFFREVLQGLALRRVRCCVVGGVAVNLHGVPRMTYDLDLVVVPERAELDALRDVLIDLGLQCPADLDLRDFADPALAQRLLDERHLMAVSFVDPHDPLREVDVLVAPPMPPADLVARAVTLDLAGTPVRVACLSDLMAMKRASGRAHDLSDLEMLERIANEQAE